MKQTKYFPKDIEPKWQKIWKSKKQYAFKDGPKKEKYYNLVELTYPSGDLHLGHWFAFVPADSHARYKKMKGLNVFFPNGFDAFGLPAENAAIKRGIHPKDWTMKNIETMRSQFETMGTMIDWNHTAITCLPDYYKWNQWIFLKMFEKSVAYRGKALSNWCPVDQTVLANEHIEQGKCWRCGSEVIQKEVEQWFLAITKYADSLIWKDPPQADWPKQVIEGQNNWIGKSEGMLINFDGISVFTTRPETSDGATFLVVAPEHEFVKSLKVTSKKIEDYILQACKKTEMERKEDRTKSGVFSGIYVKNPVTGKDIPVWISDYVLAGYGTGAIMAVPYADERDREFAQKFNLPIIKTSFKAKPKGVKKINYHLRDWSVSRQRYWGTPVPIIHCENCGLVPVAYKDLPVKLPYNVDYTPKGKPPLASDEQWLNVKCPNCGGKAKRDAETLDTFFDSAWYYYRYVSPNFDKAPFDSKEVKILMPVDVYFGGSEHTLGHALYARFFTKFFKDLGLVSFDEFAKKRAQHGIVLAADGNKMSKSRGNVVNPDDVVKEYGADTVRLYLCFMMPYEATAPWSPSAISGVYKFLRRVWDLAQKVNLTKSQDQMTNKDLSFMHKTIKKTGEDLENLAFNTAVSALMIWLNHLSAKKSVSSMEYETFLKLLAPFAPHITEELWHLINENANSIHLENWPKVESKYLMEEEINIAVQVNGKLRDTISVKSDDIKAQEKVEIEAKKSERVAKYLNQRPKKVIYVEGKIINFVV
ncbi:MAG: leucine--tRNA ligase [Candidatus Levybacteria bacterium]|nr:leucine--tRNA ligase [Candidatus Levybacteria bacterium]